MLRVLEREAIVFRKLWRGSAFSSFVTPVMFLAAIGLGLGGLVERRTGHVAGVGYLAFVAPRPLAASAMQTAAGSPLWPVMAGAKWVRTPRWAAATGHTAVLIACVAAGWRWGTRTFARRLTP